MSTCHLPTVPYIHIRSCCPVGSRPHRITQTKHLSVKSRYVFVHRSHSLSLSHTHTMTKTHWTRSKARQHRALQRQAQEIPIPESPIITIHESPHISQNHSQMSSAACQPDTGVPGPPLYPQFTPIQGCPDPSPQRSYGPQFFDACSPPHPSPQRLTPPQGQIFGASPSPGTFIVSQVKSPNLKHSNTPEQMMHPRTPDQPISSSHHFSIATPAHSPMIPINHFCDTSFGWGYDNRRPQPPLNPC